MVKNASDRSIGLTVMYMLQRCHIFILHLLFSRMTDRITPKCRIMMLSERVLIQIFEWL